MLQTTTRTGFEPEHEMFRDQVRRYVSRAIAPHLDRYEADGIVDRGFWLGCGAAGLLCPTVPEEYGGTGLDFRFNAVVNEEISYAGVPDGITLQSDVVSGYVQHYGSHEQKLAWLPGMVSGEIIGAIAMTEPGTGSDLQSVKTVARRDGDDYVISGSKTYITNGQNADFVLVVAKTDPGAGSKGISLIAVEGDRPGFRRGRNLDKIGQNGADTSELFFDEVRVPVGNRIGDEHRGFVYLVSELPQERLSIAVTAQAGAQRAFDETVRFVKDRKAFGKAVFDFQNTRFVLADLKAKLQVGWAHLDHCIARHIRGELDAYEGAAAKLWHTDLQWEVCDAGLQLHGGAGYMNEYPIARLWRDARVHRIYGGTNEIMKELLSRSI